MEGFADYFSQAVQTSLPPGTITGSDFSLGEPIARAPAFRMLHIRETA